MIHEPMIYDFLHRNGIIIERARRERRSLSSVERNIIMVGRQKAWEKEMNMFMVNEMEMEGERDFETVLRPLQVEAMFAYYSDPFEDIPAETSYYIRASNHPGLPEGGNVGADQLRAAGVKIPKTPTYSDWARSGKKVVRS